MRMRATDVLRRPVATNSSVSGIRLRFVPAKFDNLGLLRGVRMRIATINFQLAIDTANEPVVRNHSAHGPLDKQFGVANTARPDILRFMPAHVPRKTHVTLLFL